MTNCKIIWLFEALPMEFIICLSFFMFLLLNLHEVGILRCMSH
jgi:hypothetical protein